jgi:prefoldin subunit 5
MLNLTNQMEYPPLPLPSKAIQNSGKKTVSKTETPHKEFFETKATHPSSETVKKLATCVLKMSPNQPAEAREEFVKAIIETINKYEDMENEIRDLASRISQLQEQNYNNQEKTIINLNQTPNVINTYSLNDINPENIIINPKTSNTIEAFSLDREESSFSPKKERKETLNFLKNLLADFSNLYKDLDHGLEELINQKKDLSASVCLSTQKTLDKPKERLNSLIEQLTHCQEKVTYHLSQMEDQIKTIEKQFESKKEIQNVNIIASLNLDYLDTKKLRDSIVFHHQLIIYQIKATEWKLKYTQLVDTDFAKLTQLAINIGTFRTEIDGLKNLLSKQTVQLKNQLNSTTIPRYNELAEEIKGKLDQIDWLKTKINENKKDKEGLNSLDIYDSITKRLLSQEIEKIIDRMLKEQEGASNKISTVWEDIKGNMGSDSSIPGITSRWFGTAKSLTYDINRLYTAAQEGYTSLPLDSTEGTIWTLKKKVTSPFDSIKEIKS